MVLRQKRYPPRPLPPIPVEAVAVTVSQALLNAFNRATRELNLCRNRVWTVAGTGLPELLPDFKKLPKSGSENTHESCTFDFCEYALRDFTAVQQRHECEELHECLEGHDCGEDHRCQEGHECRGLNQCKRRRCMQLRGLFSRTILNDAAERSESTVWRLDGKAMVKPSQPYMAISHVWSDGTGAGAWRDGEVNECLYAFFREIANQFHCEGIWWDTVCIPREKAARNKAIQRIQSNYEEARMTLVHDCFLRNWEWDPDTACFGILMSPWFSRGWTALELAKSRKVKVVFKGSYGPVIKDLDEEILAKDLDQDILTKDNNTKSPRQNATVIIKHLRKGITTVDELLTSLGTRYTSWPKDQAIIAGLLTGVDVAPKPPRKDISQQEIYRDILTKIGRIAPEHLFHNSATMSKVSWCPTSLFSLSIAGSDTSLQITRNLDLKGTWRCIPVDSPWEEKFIWTRTHPLVEHQVRVHLQGQDKCALLAERNTNSIGRAIFKWILLLAYSQLG